MGVALRPDRTEWIELVGALAVAMLALATWLSGRQVRREHLEATLERQQRSERELGALLESMSAGVVMVTRADRRVLFANRRFTEITAWNATPGEVLPQHLWRLERPDGTPYGVEQGTISRVLRSGSPETIADAMLVTSDGRRTPVLLSGTPVRIAGSEDFDAVVVVMQDRRDLAQALEKVHEWESRFRAVARVIGQTVYEWRLADGHMEFSETLESAFGWRLAQVATHGRWITILHPEEVLTRQAAIDASRVAGRPFSIDYRVRHRDGSWRWVHERGEHRFDASGRAVSVVGAIADITEQRLLEEQLRQSQKMETLGTLAGGIAHDFNNQLTAVIGHLTLIEEAHVTASAWREQVRFARRAAERCAELTRGLLTFSRMPPGNPRPTWVEATLEETSVLLRRLLPPSIVLLVDVDPTRPLIIADPGQLQQVLLNLCTNARDAMPNGGTLQITTRAVYRSSGEPGLAAGDYLEIEVSDTGPGIRPEILPRIFEPFFSTKPVGQGTGLGLAIAYGIVTHHRGRIEVDSSPAGTAFRVLLPAAQTRAADEHDPGIALAHGPVKLDGRTILVADDEPGIVRYVAGVIESAGGVPILATDGDRALARLLEDPTGIEAVVMDLTMPGTPARLIVEGMRRVRPGLPIVVMSGFAADSQVLAEMPGVPFLPKPFTPRRLLQLIAHALPTARRSTDPSRV
jgi:PAS domain S-box-containing protein